MSKQPVPSFEPQAYDLSSRVCYSVGTSADWSAAFGRGESYAAYQHISPTSVQDIHPSSTPTLHSRHTSWLTRTNWACWRWWQASRSPTCTTNDSAKLGVRESGSYSGCWSPSTTASALAWPPAPPLIRWPTYSLGCHSLYLSPPTYT